MERVDVSCVLPFIINSKIIGFGVNSICFLLPDNDTVLKIFRKNDRTRLLLKQKVDNYSFEDKLNMLSYISNDTLIGPEKNLYVDEKLSGYFLKYVGDTRLDKVDTSIRISNLFINYDKALTDIEKLSLNHFQFFDLARENMFLNENNEYKIIDLDRYKYKKDKDVNKLFHENMNSFFRMILWTIFNTKDNEYPIFDDDFFHQFALKKINCSDLNCINKFINIIENLCEENNPTLLSIRKKIKYKNCHNDYYK